MTCGSFNYCPAFSRNGHNNGAYVSHFEYAAFPEAVYEDDKREWRRFQTEFSFPIKTDNFKIMDILREFDDIPDNFFRWEVINSNMKKGTIKKTMRTITKGSSNRFSASRLKTDEEKKIPPNTVVMVWLCVRHSGSPEGDKKFDQDAINKHKEQYPNSDCLRRVVELQAKLFKCFFDIG